MWLFQLCHDRRYLVTQDELDQTLETFKETYGDKPRYFFMWEPETQQIQLSSGTQMLEGFLFVCF